MKERVSLYYIYREIPYGERDDGTLTEDGSGVAYQADFRKATTGPPVTAERFSKENFMRLILREISE